MRVLHVCETVKGGTATYLNQLIPMLGKELGNDNTLLLMPYEHADQIPDIPSNLLTFFKRTSRLNGLVYLWLSVLRNLYKYRPDIVHAHSTFAGVPVRLFAPLFGTKVIYCPHGWAMERDQSTIQTKTIQFIEWALAKLTSHIICISNHEKEVGINSGIPDNKLTVIHNGINLEPPSFTPIEWSDDRLKVLYVGRLDPIKGADILVKSVEGLENKLNVRIIGEPVTSEKRDIYPDLPHVEFLGWKDSFTVSSHMSQCDVVVVPSRWEAFGLVVIEAMRLKKAVIASDVGGLRNLITNGLTGYKFEKNNSDELRKLLLEIDKKKLAEIGLNGHNYFRDNFSAESMMNGTLNLYNNLNTRQAA